MGTTLIAVYYAVKANTVITVVVDESSNLNTNSFTQVLKEELIFFDLMSTFALVLPLLLIVLLFLILHLETVVNAERIRVRYFPFLKRTFNWSEVETAPSVKYGFVGYGIRISVKYGTVYNVKGSIGLAITLKNGKNRLIGTQRPRELEAIVKSILK